MKLNYPKAAQRKAELKELNSRARVERNGLKIIDRNMRAQKIKAAAAIKKINAELAKAERSANALRKQVAKRLDAINRRKAIVTGRQS